MSARLTANEQNNLYCQQDQDILTTYPCKQYKYTVVNLLSKHREIYRLLLVASHAGFFVCFTMCTKTGQHLRRVGDVHVK